MKKGIVAIAAIFGVLAITSGAFAAQHYLITSSSQIKNGVIKLHDLSPGARNALHGAKGATGDRGPQGPKGDIGPQGPAGTPAPTLQRLAGNFSATNASVATTLDGVQFGPYSDGGAWGGSVRYDGANGLKLSDISQLSYAAKYSARDGHAPIGQAYLRIFLNDGHDDVVFDATQCATEEPTVNVLHTYEVTTGDVRYDDDPCNSGSSQQSWASVKAAHADDVISGIYVTTGWTGGTDLTALLRSLSVNGHEFTFGSA